MSANKILRVRDRIYLYTKTHINWVEGAEGGRIPLFKTETEGIMSTKPQNKRITKQIRVGEYLHRRLKLEAVKEGKTISKLADKIIGEYFKKL